MRKPPIFGQIGFVRLRSNRSNATGTEMKIPVKPKRFLLGPRLRLPSAFQRDKKADSIEGDADEGAMHKE